jgi:hypothetical protein
MEHKGRFTKIGRSKERMYGPRGLLVCGYGEGERSGFLKIIGDAGLAGTRVVFASSRDLGTGVGDMLTREHEAGPLEESDMPRAVVMSGLTQDELHNLMGTYKKAGSVPQIWATLTPVSEKWSLKYLLAEVQSEHKAMKNR